jgi:hypothetical protein
MSTRNVLYMSAQSDRIYRPWRSFDRARDQIFLRSAMLLVRRTLGKFSAPPPLSRRLSSRASAVLSALEIPTTPIELPGVYDGEWKGSGEVFQSVCPATGEVLANVNSVSCNICSACCPSSSTMLVAARRVSYSYYYYCTALLLRPTGITG